MYCPRQFSLLRFPRGKTAHGGSLTLGKRKMARPISTRESMHVVLRSERAKGKHSLLRPENAKLFCQLMKRYGQQFEVRVYDFALVGNHAHLILKAKTRRGFQNFLRVFAGQTAQRITGSKPGTPLSKRFWDLLVYSRIIAWGRAYEIAKKYIRKNILEGGSISRVSWLKDSG